MKLNVIVTRVLILFLVMIFLVSAVSAYSLIPPDQEIFLEHETAFEIYPVQAAAGNDGCVNGEVGDIDLVIDYPFSNPPIYESFNGGEWVDVKLTISSLAVENFNVIMELSLRHNETGELIALVTEGPFNIEAGQGSLNHRNFEFRIPNDIDFRTQGYDVSVKVYEVDNEVGKCADGVVQVLIGDDKAAYRLTHLSVTPQTVSPGATVNIGVSFYNYLDEDLTNVKVNVSQEALGIDQEVIFGDVSAHTGPDKASIQITIPAGTPDGTYEITPYLYIDGEVLEGYVQPLTVTSEDLSQYVILYDIAEYHYDYLFMSYGEEEYEFDNPGLFKTFFVSYHNETVDPEIYCAVEQDKACQDDVGCEETYAPCPVYFHSGVIIWEFETAAETLEGYNQIIEELNDEVLDEDMSYESLIIGLDRINAYYEDDDEEFAIWKSGKFIVLVNNELYPGISEPLESHDVLLAYINIYPSDSQVSPTEHAPVITSIPVTSVVVNTTYSYDVNAEDVDGDTITYSLVTAPENMTINVTNGLITWYPNVTGQYTVVVLASAAGLDTNQTFTISVNLPPAPAPVSMLRISDLEVTVDDDDNNYNNGETIEDVNPGDSFDVEVTVENFFTNNTDMQDVRITVTLEDIDDNNDIKEKSDYFDLDSGDDFTKTFNLKIPTDADEDTYVMKIYVEGEDEDNNDWEETWELEVDVKKNKHQVDIVDASLSRSTIQCLKTSYLDITLENVGSRDEDVELIIKSTALGLHVSEEFELKEGNSDNEFKKTYFVDAERLSQGNYPISVEVKYSGEKETETVDVIVEACSGSSSSSTTGSSSTGSGSNSNTGSSNSGSNSNLVSGQVVGDGVIVLSSGSSASTGTSVPMGVTAQPVTQSSFKAKSYLFPALLIAGVILLVLLNLMLLHFIISK